MTRICEKCGAPLREGARFCTKCGHSVTAQPQPSPQPRPQQPSRQASQNRPKTNPRPRPQQPIRNSAFGMVLLGLAVMIVTAVAVVKFIDYRYDKQDAMLAMASGQEEGGGGTTDAGGNGDEGSNSLLLTEETLKYLKEHPVEVTPENSPGNPDFIEVTYTEEERASAPTCAALVSRERPEVDIPELGVHVNMKSWNLEYEQDSLIVKRLPDKVDETTGMILHSYDYSLVSKQHNFLTDVEFTAPVQGDPDAFAGFVTYNKATGRWEEVYCELSEDGRTFTAHLPHFSGGAALETVKKEGMEAIDKYKIDGKSIFVQLKSEMQPKYKETQHYLYPVTVARTADLEFFFNKQQKNKTFINRNILGKDNTVEKDLLQIVSGWFGYGSKVSDVAGNAGGTVGVAKGVGLGFQNISNGALDNVSSSCFLIGYAALALEIANQLADNKDFWTIVDKNKVGIAGTLLSYIGLLSSIAGEGTILFATIGGGIAAGTLGTAVTVISAIVFACTANETIDAIIQPIAGKIEKEVFDLEYPLGVPTSIAEAALQCYMEDYAHSDRGYYTNKVSSWDRAWGRQESPEIDSAMVYALQPQKILDHNPKNWLVAYDCLVKHHVDNPKQMFEAYDNMFKNFVDAFWNEPTEIKKKYIRMACQKYIEVDMRYKLNNIGGTEEPAMTVQGAEIFHMPKIDTTVYKFTPKAESEWKEIQQNFVDHGNRLKKEERDSRPNDYRMAGKGSEVTEYDVWDAVFKEWDAAGVDNKELRYLGDPEEQKAFFHDKYIKLYRYKLTPLLQDYYRKQYHNSIEEVRRLLYNRIIPLLNTRLTFYSNNLEYPNDIIKPTIYGVSFTPTFEFKCNKKAQFRPGNAYDVKPCFPLVLTPNKKNSVLLETTVYHYLMFDCPQEVETNITVDGKPIMARANWDSVTLVQDKRLKATVELMEGVENNDYLNESEAVERFASELQTNVADTKIPVEYEIPSDGHYHLTSITILAHTKNLRIPNDGDCGWNLYKLMDGDNIYFDLPPDGGEFTINASGEYSRFEPPLDKELTYYDTQLWREKYKLKKMTIKGYVNKVGGAEFTLEAIVNYQGNYRLRDVTYEGRVKVEKITYEENTDVDHVIDVKGHGFTTQKGGYDILTLTGHGKISQKGEKRVVPHAKGDPIKEEVDVSLYLEFRHRNK